MKVRRSWRNPPSTGYERPTVRKFYVWRDRHVRYGSSGRRHGWGESPWRWMCTFCDPPSIGFRARAGAWQAIIGTSMPRHFEHRKSHHQWVARK
jgi:hypothetical protein